MKITKDQVVYAMSRDNAPVATVSSGSEVLFETCDCFSDQITSADAVFNELDWQRINPATGPVYVEGAEPGDALKVTIKRITLTSNQAVMVTAPQLGVIGDELDAPKVTIVPIENDHAVLPGNVRVPLNPMVGVIGVAPAGEAISCGTPDSHGGNMDCKMITAGSTLWLPVNVPGALFGLGDLHAAMGDGEVSVCGLEIPGEVLVELTVVKNRRLPLPMLENSETLFTLASALTLDAAAAMATRHMAHFIADNTSLTLAEAISILSIAGDLQICQVVDPLKTCRYALPKSVAEQLSLRIEGEQA
ncbi:acetamidase [Klebsiella oxytoca]|uniref:acetamidase/formamidase family protein n=1 Tax=Klebsiella oxytoca TaxID=571 RepID=UPI0007CCD1FF|nr:acetamidase/formamidase family protein [Klebsiella oxytoca]EJY1762110.1 acetamidase/formamidase family protein [Klebsiella oxytoca]MBG2598292.1 acetamidase/formamidase family protein [Klebsiella oxytoca]MDM4256372.1 acetamidase/formamidase family protein [Klebsiella oxytoca]SAQ07256.1 acetamidase [Klebsiella oxytoca]SAQ13534.1 acetamidase [Klebsiella oxytoca]